MRKLAIYALVAVLSFPAVSVVSAQSRAIKPYQIPPTQPPTPLGFGTVLCVADGISAGELPSSTIIMGPVTIQAASTVSSSNGLSAVTVSIDNSKTSKSSLYVVTFVDNDSSATLNCGDTIVSIVPA